MAWCHQATSHYLSQCWPRSVPPNGVTRPQWVKLGSPSSWNKTDDISFSEHDLDWCFMRVGMNGSAANFRYCCFYFRLFRELNISYKRLIDDIIASAWTKFSILINNSLWSGGIIWHWWAGSSLVQVMACHLFSIKPLPKPMSTYCQLNHS